MPVVTPPLGLLGNDRYQGKFVTIKDSEAKFAASAALCPNCRNPFGVEVEQRRNNISILKLFGATEHDAIDAMRRSFVVRTLPHSPREFEIDQDLPERVREPFVFVQEDAANKRNPAGILSQCRACLDVALKELGEESGGRRDRINRLADSGVITRDIAAWSQKLWKDGSDAVHDLDADIQTAIDHVEFLKLFFEVAFKLPRRVRDASHGALEAESPNAEDGVPSET